MIKLENTEVLGWEAAIRGMRNPMNSWERSDTVFLGEDYDGYNLQGDAFPAPNEIHAKGLELGNNDHKLMINLAKAGSVDAKYRRMIVVTVDITAPLYWWKEFDTYKVGTVANSCSTMHKIHVKEFVLEDFSCEHLGYLDLNESRDKDEQKKDDDLSIEAFGMYPTDVLLQTIDMLNAARKLFLETKDKHFWWQMIQLLPSSYNQRRTVMLNYEVLAGIYPKRKDHKLDEWHDFCDWIKSLPYSEIITVEEN